MNERISQCITDNQGLFVQLRRDLHRIPETAFTETKTAAYVAARLQEWGYTTQEGVGQTGVVALLEGGAGHGPVLAVRADMDALAVTEQTGLPFTSEHPGRMHACGHDSHMAMALGAAYVLAQFRHALAGTVKFIFQPSEEQPTGAGAMIADGVLTNPVPDGIVGLHNWPGLPVGQLALRSGPVTGSVDRFEITIAGRGGHGAKPHETVDPVVMASHCVLALQAVVSRLNDPVKPLVLTIGAIHGGEAFNVIPHEVCLTGTIRAADPAVQKLVPDQMQQVLNGVTAAYGGTAALAYQWGIPSVVNDAAFTQRTEGYLRRWFPDDQVVELAEPSLVGEDYSLFLEAIPGTFFFLGTGAGDGFGLHHPKYSVPEEILSIGVKSFCAIVWEFFSQK